MGKIDEGAERDFGHHGVDGAECDPDGAPAANRIQTAIAALAAASSPVSETDDFFQDCVFALSRAYRTKFALIGVFTDETKSAIRTLAVAVNGKRADNFTYELAGTPCKDALDAETVFISGGVADAYPDDAMLVDMGLESYFGTSLISPSGEVIGVTVVTDTARMKRDPWIDPILGLFADRIAFELEREKAEQELELAASVFEGLTEAVMIFGPDWRIRKVNRAFTEITGWEQDEVIGMATTILCSERHDKGFYQDIFEALQRDGHWEGEIWSRHKCGGVFPERRTIDVIRDPASNDVLHYFSVFSDISEQKYAEQRIQRLAYYDQTTDLPNRSFFQERLSKAISESRRTGDRFALLSLDLDNFKLVNDTNGHTTGDRLLNAVAERLLRLPPQSFFSARLGGDEFSIICCNIDDGLEGSAVLNSQAEEIVKMISMPYIIDGEEFVITASIGIAVFPADGDDAQSLIKASDLAAFAAKKKGRNRFEHYRTEFCQHAEKQIALIDLLRKAIQSDQFEMHYQSKHAVGDGRIIGYEALIRWQLGDGVSISPGQFIPVAEESGLIIPIGEWVLREVCRQSIAWRDAGRRYGRLSLNISGRQLANHDVVSSISRIVEETGADPRDIELEITETWLMEDPAHSADVLTALREMGFHLSIDDFGVAYSSMNYLKHFPVTTIKIDRSFTRDMVTEKDTSAIVSAIIAMGHSLGLTVLAEGVETAEQLEQLTAAGCDEVQGFFFSRPVAAAELFGDDAGDQLLKAVS